ncbi:hypothetical protein ACH5RR_000405 [Cinchona calisaya]|uniref:C2H2-type domain-containing protein n=1 Tax=Cinchona calisaya TaxID=153742 RepID=A0ABD3B0Q8_9GENT
MEKHRCKLCFRSFVNGKALGGHMRSHMMNLYSSFKAKKKEEFKEEEEISESTPSSEEEEEENEESGDHHKGLVELDQEFCSNSVVVQDRESETEESSKNPICRRSKRAKKSRISDSTTLESIADYNKSISMKEPEKQCRFSTEFVETELPVSSISDTTPEEDVAYCLMMLSRDKWKKEEDSKNKNCYDLGVVKKLTKNRRTSRGKYRCEDCNKVFRSYQALGGHRASHKRIKALISNYSTEEPGVGKMETGEEDAIANNAVFSSVIVEEKKMHECPVCYRVFSSGQALGGHKRSHVMGAAAAATPAKSFSSRIGETLIDLNLPAPIDDDDDDDSQIELSAVSDAEFVKTFKQ